jgi:N-acetylglucosamine-6-phosphate deacetylase
MLVMPGLVDIHVHGAGGADTTDGTREALAKMVGTVARFGTTSLCPTLYPAPPDEMDRQIGAVRDFMRDPAPGARVLGMNLEGPFLSPAKHGALDPSYMQEPSKRALERLLEAADGNVSLMSVAPELPGALEVIRRLRELGIRSAIGHSDANHQETIAGINAGANHVTHVYNALRRVHHRDPGVMGTVLTNDELTCEVIADLHHLHPIVIKLVATVKPIDKLVLVTDAIRYAGLAKKKFTAGGKTVEVVEGVPRLADGTIAGSILTLNRGIANMVETQPVTVDQAVAMATIIPAKVIGVNHRRGNLLPGSYADVAVLDRDFNCRLTMVEGRIVHDAI